MCNVLGLHIIQFHLHTDPYDSIDIVVCMCDVTHELSPIQTIDTDTLKLKSYIMGIEDVKQHHKEPDQHTSLRSPPLVLVEYARKVQWRLFCGSP